MSVQSLQSQQTMPKSGVCASLAASSTWPVVSACNELNIVIMYGKCKTSKQGAMMYSSGDIFYGSLLLV